MKSNGTSGDSGRLHERTYGQSCNSTIFGKECMVIAALHAKQVL